MQRILKAGLIFLCMFFAALVNTASGQTLKDFFNVDQTSALYLGVDFTKAKLIDDLTANESDIVARQYNGINELVIAEPKKFDLNAAFHKTSIDHDLGFVSKKNEKADASKVKSTNSADFHHLKEADISDLVKGYDFGDKKGIGILFVMEAMSKSAKTAAIWVTFIDMKAKKVLYTERLEEKVGMAIGFRNYWGNSIKKLLDEIEGDKYKDWKKKFS